MSVPGLTGSLNFTLITVPTDTPCSPLTGVTETTDGGVVSGCMVVKRSIKPPDSGFPASSVTAEVIIRLYEVPMLRDDTGVNVIIFLSVESASEPSTLCPVPLSRTRYTDVVVTLSGASGSLNDTVSEVFTDTSTALSARDAPATTGGTISAT